MSNARILANLMGTSTTVPSSKLSLSAADMPTGSVLQVVNATSNTSANITNSSYQTTGLTATITPSSTSSKILVSFSAAMYNNVNNSHAIASVFRGTTSGTNLGNDNGGFSSSYAANTTSKNVVTGTVLDTPATTSATTYTVAMKTDGATSGSVSTYINVNSEVSTITLMEIAG